MKRRTLDLIFAVGGLLVALLILVLGLVLQPLQSPISQAAVDPRQ